MLYPLDGDLLCSDSAIELCHIKKKWGFFLSTCFFESHFCLNFSEANAVEIRLPNFKVSPKW